MADFLLLKMHHLNIRLSNSISRNEKRKEKKLEINLQFTLQNELFLFTFQPNISLWGMGGWVGERYKLPINYFLMLTPPQLKLAFLELYLAKSSN